MPGVYIPPTATDFPFGTILLPAPPQPVEGMQPFELLPEQAVNLTLVWYWTDEPYGALQVGRYRWAVQLVR